MSNWEVHISATQTCSTHFIAQWYNSCIAVIVYNNDTSPLDVIKEAERTFKWQFPSDKKYSQSAKTFLESAPNILLL